MLSNYFQAVRRHQPNEADFNAIKQTRQRFFSNEKKREPLRHSDVYLRLFTSELDFSHEQYEAALKDIAFNDARHWGSEVFCTTKLRLLISGDVTKTEVVELMPCLEMLELI